MRRVGIELGAVGALETGDMAGELDGGELHAEADAQVRHLVFARIADRRDLAFGAALAEAAGDQDGIHLLQRRGAAGLDRLGVDVVDAYLAARVDAGMHQGFGQRLVGLGEIDVLADEGDIDLVLRMLERVDQLLPHREVGGRPGCPACGRRSRRSSGRAAWPGSCRCCRRRARRSRPRAGRW
jgi:hypothetical protein